MMTITIPDDVFHRIPGRPSRLSSPNNRNMYRRWIDINTDHIPVKIPEEDYEAIMSIVSDIKLSEDVSFKNHRASNLIVHCLNVAHPETETSTPIMIMINNTGANDVA